ncbi:DUF2635 domain-containing protein [Streptomyces sp. RKAG293]|uniref:DUF2635 domain-containing protein n=1 Tax=Streptomyces sp. RKAG293 TaxID=2893403 RepID=UPI0020342755|nr:DUF2635 domain-containing protein [Streptomyces sp. RKAG293]MCM2421714.1 DUF2635 domain-containing protein [Streptomyces sp. RKAG293]
MADPLDDRLRDLARDTEPLIVLARPADVRRRGERRRARRRVGAVAVVAAAALAVGSWAVLPRLENGAQTPAVGGSSSPDPLPTDPLTGELLPPTALPWDSYWHWRTVAGDVSAKIPLMHCGASLYDPASASVRFFQGNENSSARYAIHALSNEAKAAAELNRIRDELGKCGLVAAYTGKEGGTMETVFRVYAATKQGGRMNQVWLANRGRYVSVLQVVMPVRKGPNPPYFDGTPVQCMARSLERLAPPSTQATPGTPSTSPSSAFAGGSVGGGVDQTTGGGVPADPPPDAKFPPGYFPSTSPDRC